MANIKNNTITVIGGGLAGSEAAWQAANRGCKVTLYEMRPSRETGAHKGDGLAELICSNSLGSNLSDRASGLLKDEMRSMGSLLLSIADETKVPAGSALAVDRELFSARVTEAIEAHPNIEVVRKEVEQIPDEGIIILASGPLTSPALAQSLATFCGQKNLYFFDAISPIIEASSINMETAYSASRWDEEGAAEGDYINLPFHNKADYLTFFEALTSAQRIELKDFELAIETGVDAGNDAFFEGCLPVEIIASRGQKALLYGPLRPVGLKDPRVERPPYAVAQLRKENLAGDLYNIVGFQTNLTFPEQRRVLRMIPGLENAEFARYGQMHRNTFISAPDVLQPTLQANNRKSLFMAGQITGVEGYAGNIATGVVAGINAARMAFGDQPLCFPVETMIGSLLNYITHTDPKTFQPMKANFGILPALPPQLQKGGKRDRATHYSARANNAMKEFLGQHDLA